MNDNTVNINKYSDIITLPHHTSKKHPRISKENRAAQFSPFAALTGYGDAINETARLTKKKSVLDEDDMNALNVKLQIISDNIYNLPEINIEYFVQDEKKSGGTYITITGNVRRIDEYKRTMILADGRVISIDDIYRLDGELFDKFSYGMQ